MAAAERSRRRRFFSSSLPCGHGQPAMLQSTHLSNRPTSFSEEEKENAATAEMTTEHLRRPLNPLLTFPSVDFFFICFIIGYGNPILVSFVFGNDGHVGTFASLATFFLFPFCFSSSVNVIQGKMERYLFRFLARLQ